MKLHDSVSREKNEDLIKLSSCVAGCGGYLTSPKSSIEIPEGIPEGESCIWVISLPKSGPNNSTNIVQFSLSHPKLSSNSSM